LQPILRDGPEPVIGFGGNGQLDLETMEFDWACG
jgi:hypothetical protein